MAIADPAEVINQLNGPQAIFTKNRPAWSESEPSFSAQFIQQLFEKQVETTPHAIAVISGDGQLTYAELNRKANKVAHYLRKSGVKLESRVGVCLERSSQALVAVLAILKAGGAYVPLDPDYPAERLKYMLADSRVTVLLTTSLIKEKLTYSATTIICLDDNWSSIEEEAADNPEQIVHEENVAYVIYTSGSTGNPKGVMVDHRGLANLLHASRKKFGFNHTDVMPCLASFSFDISLFELCNPICSGGTVVIWDQRDVLDVQLLVESLEDFTLLHCVPTLMRQLVNFMRENQCRATRIRQVFVGGEEVGVQLLEQMREVFPRAEIYALYGPTEATMICAGRLVTSVLEAPPIGAPIENMQLYVLDQEMKLSPAGVAGELYLGGVGLAVGYLNRPDLTAERFIPNCFSAEVGDRLYRTGDSARWDAEGNLQFIGRVDQQVKIHGHRIELGEIEATLARCPGVAEAAVTVREDQPGQPRLVAYVVAESAQRSAPSQDTPWISPAINEYAGDLTPITPREKNEAHPFYETIVENVEDKTILLVGTNQENLILKACVEGRAKRIYVAETTADAYARTERLVQENNFHHVTLFLLGGEGPPIENRIDICISDLLGDISGSKGLEIYLQQLRTVTQPETNFYPQSCTTYLSAVELPESLRHRTEFDGTTYQDVRQIFAARRYPFDLRVRVHQLPPENLISDESIFEQITCSEPRVDTKAAAEHQFQLTISRPATLCGFVLTPKLYGDMSGGGQFDCCFEADAPVFVPVFMPGLQVESGDRIEGRCVRRLSTEDGRHLDYTVEGRLLFRHGETKSFFYRLPFIQRVFEGSKFYKTLFSATSIEQLLSGEESQDAREIVRELRNTLKSKLPEYMVPSAIVKMERFPVTPNGKLDRQALPAPEYSSDLAAHAPIGPHQEILCSLFADALGISHVSPDESFFDLGGNSVILMQLIKRVRERLGVNLSITTFFEAPTVAGLEQRLQLNIRSISEPVLAGS